MKRLIHERLARPAEVLNHLHHVSDVLLRKVKAFRNLTVYPDDTFLVSYPRSGNTWLRFLLCNLLYADQPATFLRIDSKIPSIYEYPDHVLCRLPRPRILKSHEYFDPLYKKVIYIVRDPRDVAVSSYHFNMKWRSIPEGYPIEEFVPRFISGRFDLWQRGAAWGDHVKSWLGTRQGQSEFLLVRYADLKRDTMAELGKVGSYLNLDVTPERLAQAIELSSPERMRELEHKESAQFVETKKTRQDIPFVRKALAGEWKTALPRRSVEAIEEAWGPIMEKLGFELTTKPPSQSVKAGGDFTVQSRPHV